LQGIVFAGIEPMPAIQSTSGQWSGVFDWPIIGIHCILTPDGKVLTYGTDQLGQQGAQLIYDVWDIATNTHYTLPNRTPTDMFCSAAALVPETGQILIMGGDSRGHDPTEVNLGVHDANVFDPATMSVSPLDPDCPIGTVEGDHICGGHMQFERWYPTAVTLANGKIVVMGGRDGTGDGVGTPELYTPFSGWRTLDGATSEVIKNDWDYPRAWLDSDGMINCFESTSTAAQPGKLMLMDPSGDGRVTVVGTVPFVTSNANPAIMYDENKVLALANNGDAWIMDMSGNVPTFTKTASLNESRLWSNMVVLADGSVMVSGGSGVDNQLTDVTNEVAIWNPSTGQWKIGADAAIPRLYHSTTILLPDATVLSLGGGAPGPLVNTNGEIYSPPYLFDQNGNLAKRPVISSAPDELKPGATFTISVDDATAIDRLTLIKYGSVTHALNMAASKIELPFMVDPNNKLVVHLPENSNVLTPGDWMLFAIGKDGTPSVAPTVKIDVGGELLSEQVAGWVTLNGDATYDATTGDFALTKDAQNQKGALMSNERIDLRSDFDISFNIYLGNKDAGGNGMAFVLHNDPFGGDATGAGGSSLGAYGIRNGLGIAFDTNGNPLLGSIANDHTNFFKTDSTLGQAQLSPQVDLGNVEDGNWHGVHVSWDAAKQTLSYFLDGREAGTLTGDLASQYFAGFNYAYFGFTAATGAVSNRQQVEINQFDALLEDGTQVHSVSGSAANIFDGGYGRADTISGFDATDTVSYARSKNAVIIDLTDHVTWDGKVNDNLSGIENGIGSAFNDHLWGNSGNNVLDGGAGGADDIRGYAGSDTVSYASSKSGVIIDLASQVTWDGSVNDSLSSIENAIGSAFNDHVWGSAGDNVLDGGAGGADNIKGFGGSDTVSYASSKSGVIIDLTAQVTWDGSVNDTLSSIENATGSRFNDKIWGNAAANVLDGGQGADVLTGYGGNDTFMFRRGEANGDTVADFTDNGGNGGDRLDFFGYGTAAEGATFSQLDATHWSINSADGSVHDVITLKNGATVQAGDFLFH